MIWPEYGYALLPEGIGYTCNKWCLGTNDDEVDSLLQGKLYNGQAIDLVHIPYLNLFGYALVARSTNYVLGRGASSNEGLYDGVLSCARANDEDSHPSEFTFVLLGTLSIGSLDVKK